MKEENKKNWEGFYGLTNSIYDDDHNYSIYKDGVRMAERWDTQAAVSLALRNLYDDIVSEKTIMGYNAFAAKNFNGSWSIYEIDKR